MAHILATSLNWVNDPGHGWLEVPLTDIAVLQIEGRISPYSFIFEGYAYLEEDADATIYFQRLDELDLPYPLTSTTHVNCFNRSLPGFRDETFDKAWWDGLRADAL